LETNHRTARRTPFPLFSNLGGKKFKSRHWDERYTWMNVWKQRCLPSPVRHDYDTHVMPITNFLFCFYHDDDDDDDDDVIVGRLRPR
jgi:hypothetical protein